MPVRFDRFFRSRFPYGAGCSLEFRETFDSIRDDWSKSREWAYLVPTLLAPFPLIGRMARPIVKRVKSRCDEATERFKELNASAVMRVHPQTGRECIMLPNEARQWDALLAEDGKVPEEPKLDTSYAWVW